MRVTNRMAFDLAQSQMMAARNRAIDAQQQVTTGLRVVHPGDDPAAAGVMVTQGAAIQRLDTIDKTTSSASGEVQVADGAMQSVATLLQRAQQLAVQLGNDTYSASDRAGGAAEINGISSQIAQLMNTQVAGRYIFGGNVDNAPPFDAAGNYSGDSAVRQIEVAPGLLQNASVRADQTMKGVGGGVDVFATLSTLSTALAANDGPGIRAAVGGVSSSTDQVAAALTTTGAMLSAFDSAQQIGSVAKDSAQKVLSAQSEVDIFEATSNLALAQQSLQATLAVTAQSFSVSLLDYLK
ncbi:MAG TPA: flagellar hook-associated protein FlgL [Polyangia bacterium]